jgi:hypothetical protein
MDNGYNSDGISMDSIALETNIEHHMPVPPEEVYETQNDLWQSIQDWAASNGYCFRIGRSKQVSKTAKKYHYVCDRSGKPPTVNPAIPRLHNSTSHKTDCEFSILATQSNLGWEVRHRQGDKYSVHNHEPSDSPIAHPGHRKVIKVQQDTIRDLQHAGMCLYL